MDTGPLKKFAPEARNALRQQVGAKLDAALTDGSAARREAREAVTKIEAEVAATSRDDVVERVAYTWFNRFMALCFMDACGHNTPRVLSPRAGETRPEILSEAVAGVIDASIAPHRATAVRDLLEGRMTSADPQAEAFRHLVVASCNGWSATMPFLFEATDDPTELLMPEDLLSPDSVVARLRGLMTPEACKDVEIIGWIYQFYIAEKKDQVFAGLKKNVKITAQNIPAATQLFTPHWIVRYLVENSLGRLWLLNKPSSNLAAQMDYYIAPEEPEADFLVVSSPEEIKICDPACGSGHMLTYAFDLLYAIYEEEGYDPTSIPALILTHNLYGIEIDGRAGALAAFALTMKAASKNRRFLRAPVQPNICVMENVAFEAQELADYIGVAGRDLFTAPLRDTLGQFAQAKNFGALITPLLPDVSEARRVLEGKDFTTDLLRRETHLKALAVLKMAEYLAPRYHVVVANPPYMGGKGMNQPLVDFARLNYPDSKHDLFAMFMERCLGLMLCRGQLGMLNLPSWMFLSSYENLRKKLLMDAYITSLVHCGRGIFGSDFGTVAFCLAKQKNGLEKEGVFRRLFEKHVDVRKPEVIERLFLDKEYGKHTSRARDFQRVPGSPIVYWASKDFLACFDTKASLEKVGEPRQGMATSDVGRFLRFWFEVASNNSLFTASSRQASTDSKRKWFPTNKGGGFRKWFGNNEYVVNWKNDGQEVLEYAAGLYGSPTRTIKNMSYYFRPSVTWGMVTSSAFSARVSPKGHLFDVGGPSAFPIAELISPIAAFLNSSVFQKIITTINPTMNFNSGDLAKAPFKSGLAVNLEATRRIDRIVATHRADWDAYETSWDFTTLPLLDPIHRQPTLATTYIRLRAHWQSMTDEMLALEEENNRIFIDAYGLADELTPDVPLNEITLTCNPAYRYGGKKTADELEAQLQADTLREFMHYAVGCMFGRYSLDAPGLILANQGDTLAEYLAKVPEPSFAPDADNVIPMLDRDWFPDDITDRFRKFLRITFGEDHFQDNLAFIEAALGKDIRKYFTKDFFPDHFRRYKKRPIYWLFTSPKGTFNALIYMHRYRADTINTVLTEYLRPLRDTLEAHKQDLDRTRIDPDATPAQRGKAEKECAEIVKQIKEIEQWERDVLLPMAQKRIEIDLDDGVKVNYLKFKDALKTIPGLEAKEE